MKIKNVRPGILIIADAGLKLAPGETADVGTVTLQMQGCIEDGLLARVDVETETKPKSKPAARGAVAKAETREQPAKAGGGGKAAAEIKPEPGDGDGPLGGEQRATPGVANDSK